MNPALIRGSVTLDPLLTPVPLRSRRVAIREGVLGPWLNPAPLPLLQASDPLENCAAADHACGLEEKTPRALGKLGELSWGLLEL
jgi:hypothetical protein